MQVVAALIEHEGKILACQRARGQRFELMWEFPGGKVETGETLEQALVRELREELDINAKIGPEVFRTKHAYEQLREPIELIFLLARAPSGQIQNRVFEKIVWRTPESLPELDFLPADRELVTKLANDAVQLDGWI